MATTASVSVVAAPLAASKLSSSAAFGASQGQFAPLRNVKVSEGRVVAAMAKYGEEEGFSARQMVTSVVAAGLALTMAGSAFAAMGPGGKGAERTQRKANELLQGADDLIKKDSPQRFGPQQGFGLGNDESDRFSRQAGSGAVQGLQDAGSAQVSGGRDKLASNLATAKRRIDGIWGQGKGLANDVVASAQGKADEATQGVKKNLFGAAPKINLSSAPNFGSAADDVKSKADEAAASAKGSTGGFFAKIKQQGRALQGKN